MDITVSNFENLTIVVTVEYYYRVYLYGRRDSLFFFYFFFVRLNFNQAMW